MEGKIIYPEQDTVRTYREIIHQYTAQHPWAELGNDICLGAEADRPISVRDEMFAPFYLLRYANGAVIQGSDGSTRPLVLFQSQVVEGRDVEILLCGGVDRGGTVASCMFLGDRHFFDVIGWRNRIGGHVSLFLLRSSHSRLELADLGLQSHSVGGHAVGGLVCC